MGLHLLRPAIEAAQDRLLARADASANAAERAIRAVWLRLLAVIRQAEGQPHFAILHAASAALRGLKLVAPAVAEDLSAAARQAHAANARALEQQLPAAARSRLRRRRLLGLLREADEDDEPDPYDFVPLFRPPSAAEVSRIVFGSGWEKRFTQLTKLAAPDVLAALIAAGVQQGKTPAQIAREIRPAVQGVQTSARRIARTEGLRVAHDIQLEQWRELGDLVAGYQIHATLDQNTRPEHRARNGTIYYRDPKPGQKGLGDMPRPPLEADGTVAHNCRCYLTPVLDPEYAG